MHTTRDQSGKVRHVDQIQRADFVRDLPHAGEINDPRIGAPSSDDELGLLLLGELFQLVVVDGLRFFGDAVRNDLVSLARKIEVMSMSKMATMRQIKPKNGVARL